MPRRTAIQALPAIFLVLMLIAACAGGGSTQAPAGGGQGNAPNGDKLFHAAALGKNNAPGCTSCHSTDPGKTLVGPSLAGIATQAGSIIKSADYKGGAKTSEDYLRESIADPNKYVPKGFSPGIMYQNYAKDLSSQEINDLVAYLATLK